MRIPVSILMLEDNPFDAELTFEELNRGGIEYVARCVTTKEDFESALREYAPDLVISDYLVPGFDGMQALAFVASHYPGTPFILVSGAIGEECVTESLRHGAWDYVPKHRLPMLVPAVRRALLNAEERSERQRAQDALRRSEEHLQLAVKTARLGTWDLEVSTREFHVSRQCKEDYGFAPEADFGYETLRDAIHPADASRVAVCLQEALDTGSPYEAEYRIYWPDGSIHWIAAQGVAIRDERGIVARLAGVTLDITARKRVEENLARQALELTTLNADLRQFAYAASHDLQEPLRMVTIYTQLLAERLKGQTDEDLRHHFSFIEAGTGRMAALLRDLLAYMHLQTTVRDRAPVRMDDALHEVLTVMNIALKEAGAEITSDPLPEILGDDSQLQQVLQNLIENAVKYRSAIPLKVHISAMQQGPNWLFQVRDNGIGFDPLFSEQIFGLFKRLNPTQYPGTGLGLAICRRAVISHGGRIWAKSEPGVGSTFYFSIPADALPQPAYFSR